MQFTNTEINIICNALKTEYDHWLKAYSQCQTDFAQEYNIYYTDKLLELLDKLEGVTL